MPSGANQAEAVRHIHVLRLLAKSQSATGGFLYMVGASGVSEEGGSGTPTGWSTVGPGSEYHSDNDLTLPEIEVSCHFARG
jgi:hypothetical protein